MKDAKGHGSNGRGNLSVPDQHQHRIAVDTVKNPLKGVFLGGPTATQAEGLLRNKFGYSEDAIAKLKGGGVSDSHAAGALAQGGPKSGSVPVHDGAAGRSPGYNRGFADARDGLSPQRKNSASYLEGHAAGSRKG